MPQPPNEFVIFILQISTPCGNLDRPKPGQMWKFPVDSRSVGLVRPTLRRSLLVFLWAQLITRTFLRSPHGLRSLPIGGDSDPRVYVGPGDLASFSGFVVE